MFKFKGISSKDMQVVVEEEEHFIAKASQRYEMTEIEGRDGAIFDELGYSVVERPIYVQCLNINKIDDILAWLNGEGEFEYKGRKTTARFYSQLEPQRSSCIRIIDTTFIRDPFWCKVNEDYQLVKDRKDKQASGEYIHVEDSSNCRSIIGIGGNHEQETRSGKNKIEITKTTTTVNGCTHTIKDGTDTLSGTSTGWANIIIYSFTGDGKTYTLSGSPSTSKNIFISAHDNVQKKDLATSKNGSTGTFVATSGNSIDIIICVAPNLTLANELFKPQLEEGLKATVWEQGGASPSPDYPSKIEVVGSNVNLFAGGDTVTNNGVTFTKNKDDSYDIVGMAKEQANCIKFVDIQNSGIINGNIYNIHVSENLPDGVKILIEAYNDAAWIRHVLGSSLIPNVSKANIENVNKIRFTLRVEKGISVNIHNLRIKLEKDTIETAYSKYGQGCVKVTKCNKNLFDKDKALQKYELNRTTGQIKSNDLFFTSDYIRVSPNKQYFLSGKNDGESNCFYDKNKKYIDAVVLKNGLLTVPDNSNIYYLRLNSRLTAIDTTMLEKNTKKSAYEEHQGQSYIMPTQTEMLENDYLDYDNEEEVHVWGKKILDETEEINLQWDASDKHGYRIAIDNIKKTTSSSEKSLVISNSYKAYIQDDLFNLKYKAYGISNRYNNSEVIIRNDDITTVADFKAYLKSQYDAGTPVIVYYKQQTPTRLPFTDEQKAVAKELNNARTYKNVTNITTDSKAILSLDYFTVTDEKIKNEGNIQSRPILRLEKTVSEAVDITINGVRFKYNFNNDKYVEIDCENKEVKFDGLERFRSIEIGYDFPKLNIGNNEIIINDGDCIIKVIRKDRWL